MSRFGLSLSGGGFRATLFHLGVVRYLKDAGMLPQVSDLVSVSGGSIIAAHLVLNWERYNSTDKDFEDAAGEILRFVALDVRNRIVRRIPFQMPLRWLAALARRGGSRRLTSNGTMEKYLDRYLFKGHCVHELPAQPQLHILTTNVSEGGICSFHRSGMFIQHRSPGKPDRMEFLPAALAPLSLAVGASAAFPGFFPPVQVRAADIGAQEGQFPTQALTDGGVYDNLGVRAFHWMQTMWAEKNRTLNAADLHENLLTAFGKIEDTSPPALRWLASHLSDEVRRAVRTGIKESQPELLAEVSAVLGTLVRSRALQQQPELEAITLDDAAAASVLSRARAGQVLDPGWQAWLNRHLLAAILKQAAGAEVLPPVAAGFDKVLVSDAGQPFLILAETKLGFIAQSVRATDIMWDRIWQLEKENFGGDPTFRFLPVNHMVSQEEDPTALHPTVQAEVPMIRTDLDRFSPLETRALVQHGYEVARSLCKPTAGPASAAAAKLPPWDPFTPTDTTPRPATSTGPQATKEARSLRRSANRRIWSTLFDWRDWPTYVFVPLLVFIFGVLPVLGWQFYQQAQMRATVLNAVSKGMPDFKKVMELIDFHDHLGDWGEPVAIETIDALAKADYIGWEALSDTRILDLRGHRPMTWWNRTPPYVYMFHSLRVHKLPTYKGDGHLRLVYPLRGPAPEVRVKSKVYQPVIKQLKPSVEIDGHLGSITQVDLNLTSLPPGSAVNLEVEFLVRDMSSLQGNWVRFKSMMPTEIANVWMLFPTDRPYQAYKLRSFVTGEPLAAQIEEPRYAIDHPFGSVIAWSITNPKSERTYECEWTWE